jgi:energy-coupling factor transporter ATP-binding protein EcfA2
MRPKVIILDEPTSLLDPRTAMELVSLIKVLSKVKGITFIVVEHRLDLLTAVADRMVVMNEGTVALEGTPTEVLSDERAIGLGIAVPVVARLYSQLQKSGMDLGPMSLTAEELCAAVNKATK